MPVQDMLGGWGSQSTGCPRDAELEVGAHQKGGCETWDHCPNGNQIPWGMGPLDKAAVSALTYKRRRAAQNCSLQPCGQENDPMHCSLATPPSDLFRD